MWNGIPYKLGYDHRGRRGSAEWGKTLQTPIVVGHQWTRTPQHILGGHILVGHSGPGRGCTCINVFPDFHWTWSQRDCELTCADNMNNEEQEVDLRSTKRRGHHKISVTLMLG